MNTLVIQSHTQPLPYAWIKQCLTSVEHWANLHQFSYEFIGDELFDFIPQKIMQKFTHQLVVATDLARLRAIQHYLQHGFDTVVWCDADFLIFNPNEFVLPDESYALGREVWIQANENNKLTAYVKVHNAFMMFRQHNNFLNFYAETAERLLLINQGSIPPQFIGPKLLTAIHNIAQCTVLESAGMLSPLVINDVASGGGMALDLFQKKSCKPIFAANLCSSLFSDTQESSNTIQKCISALSATKVM